MFARLVLDAAYSFFLPPFGFQIRVGALYLLFSLYGCQTAEPRETVGDTACTSGMGSCLMEKLLVCPAGPCGPEGLGRHPGL